MTDYSYQVKDITKDDIDNFVKIVEGQFDREEKKYFSNPKQDYSNSFLCPIIKINKMAFRFKIKLHRDSDGDKTYNLAVYTIGFPTTDDDDESWPDFEYFESKNLKELVVKYVNTKFYYCRVDNTLKSENKYNESKTVNKFFPSGNICNVCYDNISFNIKLNKCNHTTCFDCWKQLKKKECPECKKCYCLDCEECENDY